MKLPEQLGRYKVLRLLGAGGMGRVYLGQHQDMGWVRAIKTLRLEDGESEAHKRFLREAKATAEIEHPNVVRVYEFSYDEDEGYYFVMEHLNGEDLDARIQRAGRLPWSELRGLLIQAVRGLITAHELGIFHRDIKPSNLFAARTGDGEVLKVIDFGIAKITDRPSNSNSVTGHVVGTPYYVPPEQIMLEGVDGRSDIYSLGATIYHCLVGAPPFQGLIHEILQQQLGQRPVPPRQAAPDVEIPEAVQAIVMRCLEKRPEARFQTARELEAALLASPDPAATLPRIAAPVAPPRGKRRSGMFAAITAGALLAVVGAVVFWPGPEGGTGEPSGEAPSVAVAPVRSVSVPVSPAVEERAAGDSHLVAVAAPAVAAPEDRGPPVEEVTASAPPAKPSCSANQWKYVKDRIRAGIRKDGLVLPVSIEVTYRRSKAGTLAGARSERSRAIARGSAQDAKLEAIVQRAFRGCVEVGGPASDTVELRWDP